MKPDTFVLDENVLRSALSCSQMANTLFDLIFRNGHRIAADSELYGSYWRILGSHTKSAHHPFLQPIIGNILMDTNRFEFIPEFHVGQNKILIRHRPDVFLGQIALELGDRLICVVCKDKKTRRDLNENMQIRAVSLRDSLQLARQLNH